MNNKPAFNNKKFKNEFIVSVALLILVLFLLTRFLNYVELRSGFSFNDPILNLFEPVDLTWFTFGIIYLSIIVAVILFFRNYEIFLLAVQSYTIMVLFRITAMYLLPLDPPVKMIPLTDPFVEFFGTGQLLTKDLFFSGHTATMFLLFLITEIKSVKYLFLISTILIGLFVLLQHVHYSIDVFSAPFFSYCSYKIAFIIRKKVSVS